LSRRPALAAVFSVVLAAGATGTAQAAPSSGDGPPANHGQCVSSHSQPDGKSGRSAIAKNKTGCTPQLVCTENEDGGDTVRLDSPNNTVTVEGSGNPSAGSNLVCDTAIDVEVGDLVTFTYTLGAGTAPCGGGVPRMYVLIDGTYYNTIDGDPQCSEADGNTVTYEITEAGTIEEVAFIYDRQDLGSVTYSGATIDGVALNI
jgi:hypothetical protein